MNDELTKYYALLGLSPGASPLELKAAHRDLAKVWHPDRFLRDPRLQEKAQEKLKEINEAYDQLRSGKAKWQTAPPSSTSQRPATPTPGHSDQHVETHPQTRSVAVAQKIRWPLILAPVLIFAAVFFAASRLLRPGEPPEQSRVVPTEEVQAPPDWERQQPGNSVTTANDLPRGKDRIEVKSQTEQSGGASTGERSAAPLRPMPTVTILIDPMTSMIARPDCPVKTRMTYPSGNEPHQYCASHPAAATAPADTSGPTKESRIKSVAKRLASPGKWFGGKEKSDAGNKQDSKSP